MKSEVFNECTVVRYMQDPDLLYQVFALDEGDQPPSTDADSVSAKCPLAFIKSFLDCNFSS